MGKALTCNEKSDLGKPGPPLLLQENKVHEIIIFSSLYACSSHFFIFIFIFKFTELYFKRELDRLGGTRKKKQFPKFTWLFYTK